MESKGGNPTLPTGFQVPPMGFVPNFQRTNTGQRQDKKNVGNFGNNNAGTYNVNMAMQQPLGFDL